MKTLLMLIIASYVALLLLQPLSAQEQAAQQTPVLLKAKIYNKNYLDEYGYDLEIRLGKNRTGAEQLEVRLADGSVPIHQFTKNISRLGS